jgi:hypothetical protein
MKEVKITAKNEGIQDEYFGDYRQGITISCEKFVSQEIESDGNPK